MTRHIADHDRNAGGDSAAGGRLAYFVTIARSSGDEGSHPAAKAALRQPRTTDQSRHLREFVRIAKGRLA